MCEKSKKGKGTKDKIIDAADEVKQVSPNEPNPNPNDNVCCRRRSCSMRWCASATRRRTSCWTRSAR